MTVNILVVDDSSPMRAVITKTIKASGYGLAEIFHAANGKEALVLLQKQWMDLVMTDYNMPDMDGLALMTEMKKDPVLQTVPVLVITTEGSQKRIEAFRAQGAAGYIQKPFTPEEIREKLTEILGEMDHDGSAAKSDDGCDF